MKTVPPLAKSDIEQDLKDPAVSVYLYVGNEEDPGSNVAKAVASLLACHEIYLIGDTAAIARWRDDATVAAVLFGFGEDVIRTFTGAEAEDFQLVFEATVASRKA